MPKLFVTIVAFISFLNCNGQDFPNHPAYINNNNQIVHFPLEQVSLFTKEGVGRSKTYVILDSIHSAVRIKEGHEINIFFKPGQISDDENPIASYRLFQLNINNVQNNRRFLYISEKSKLLDRYTNFNMGLPIEVRKVDSEKLSLTFRNLKRGEYALQIGKTIYSFGVD